MNIEVLVSTMDQIDHGLLERMNIQTDAVVVNQCDRNGLERFEFKGHSITWVDTTQRGLSRSRNMALSYASGDICLLADDDIVYLDGFYNDVIKAYSDQKNADIITFNFQAKNARSSRKPRTDRRAPFYRSYSSVSLSFKRIKVLKKGLSFNQLLGAGSDYGDGEESLFLIESRKKGLKIYENHAYICIVDFGTSSWFKGYDEKFYFNKGVYLGMAYGKLAELYMLYFIRQGKKASELPVETIVEQLRKGIKAYRNM